MLLSASQCCVTANAGLFCGKCIVDVPFGGAFHVGWLVSSVLIRSYLYRTVLRV